MSRLQKLLAMSLFVDAIAGNPNRGLADRTYGDVRKPDTRQLREFSVHGQKIMAYSRKDAIKRHKHRKV